MRALTIVDDDGRFIITVTPAVSLWFEVDPRRDKETRVFELFGTGHDIPETAGAHVGSVVAPPLVLHVYERGVL